jgi:hypothetical protein
MTKFFGSNNLRAFPSYVMRTVFSRRAYGAPPPVSAKDFYLAERILYGRVDREMLSIDLKNKKFNGSTILKSLDGGAGLAAPLAVDFVAAAFNDMRKEFIKAAKSGRCISDDKYLSSLKPVRAWTSLNSLIKENRKQNYSDFSDWMLENRKANSFLDFLSFVDIFMPYVESRVSSMPFTVAGYARSRYCPMNISGLVVEIADLDPSEDPQKEQHFLNSPNWDFYHNAALQFGFSIDRQVPWRLIADLGSPAMAPYIQAAGLLNSNDTAGDVLYNYFNKSHEADYTLFKRTIVESYNAFIASRKYFTKPKLVDGEARAEGFFRQTKPLAIAMKELDDSFWFPLYAKVRYIEEGSPMDLATFERLKSESMELLRSLDPPTDGLLYFSKGIIDTSKYSGSAAEISAKLYK